MKSFLGKYYSLMPDGCDLQRGAHYKCLVLFNINELFENLQLKVLTLEDNYFKSLYITPANKSLPKTFISLLIALEKQVSNLASLTDPAKVRHLQFFRC